MTVPVLDQLPYTIHNLPYGVISKTGSSERHCAVAIGEHALDLSVYETSGNLNRLAKEHDVDLAEALAQDSLNAFAALPWSLRKAVRQQIQSDLKAGKVPEECFVPLKDVENHLPMKMGGYTDFYTSLEHCQNCSAGLSSTSIPKNWWYAPSAYNGRITSILPTPRDIHRPKNVSFSSGIDSEPVFGPTKLMDYELEMGYFVSKPIPHGTTMPVAEAKEHIFGFVLLNDWSARDHQLFEMRPLGPFHSKGFGTSISNWIVPIEALESFSCRPNTKQDPPPFMHLAWPTPEDGALDVKLRIRLVRDGQTTQLGTSNLKYMYWTPYQQLTHHAQSGCGMGVGDLIGTGTISGSGTNERGEKTELGCLFEAAQTKTKILPTSSQKKYADGYLEDGDEIILDGWCEDRNGNIVLGFGECRGRIIAPA